MSLITLMYDVQNRDVRNRCCCPTFLVAHAGPWFAILGGIITPRCIVQRLTDYLWMPIRAAHDDDQYFRNARILYALKNSLAELEEWYATIETISPVLHGPLHPLLFPSPHQFKMGDKFKYEKPLEQDVCKTHLIHACG